MSCTIQKIIDDLRCEIVDPVDDTGDGCIWKNAFLKDAIQQAVTHIMGLRCDLFPDDPKEVTLTAGECYQSFCDADCKELLEIISIDGNSCALPDEDSSDDNLNSLANCFPEYDCPTDANSGEDVIDKFTPKTHKRANSCSVIFSEAVPDDREVKAQIICVKEIDWCADEIEIPEIICGKLYEGFKHLVLSKIYATDRKSDNLMELSKLHFKMWQDFRDWLFRVDFAKRQSDWDLYRQETTQAGE